MSKTIKITGTGKASAKPDLVELTLMAETTDKDYGKAMSGEAESVNALSEAITLAGFEKDELKTADFNVNTIYAGVHDVNGNYVQEFRSYRVRQVMKLRFGLDKERLAKAINAITLCGAKPEISIAFTVKDKDAFKDELLRSAAENARKSAETLCAVSGVALGELVSIDYSFNEAHIFSPTAARFDNCERGIAGAAFSADIEPEDIEASENVTFVWEIR